MIWTSLILSLCCLQCDISIIGIGEERHTGDFKSKLKPGRWFFPGRRWYSESAYRPTILTWCYTTGRIFLESIQLTHGTSLHEPICILRDACSWKWLLERSRSWEVISKFLLIPERSLSLKVVSNCSIFATTGKPKLCSVLGLYIGWTEIMILGKGYIILILLLVTFLWTKYVGDSPMMRR